MTRHGRAVGADGGYVMVMSAMLLLPLLAFVGLAVDLGSWHAQATSVQRVTDAAALAGVSKLPAGFDQAEAMAIEVAAANGYVDGVDGVKISVTQVGADRIRVTITKDDVPQYLTAAFREGVSVTRSSVAEYVPPVRMGSPRNFLGTGRLAYSTSGLPSGALKEEFYLSVNSPCARTEDGDKLLSGWAANNGSSNYCNSAGSPSSAIPNPSHSANGYMYGVRVEDGYSGGPITIEVFDASHCPTTTSPGPSSAWHDYPKISSSTSSTFTTRFTVRNPAPDPFAGSVRQVHNVEGRSSTGSNDGPCNSSTGWRNRWRTLDTIADPVPGEIYGVQVQTVSPTNNNIGNVNNFSLRARAGSTFVACSADPAELDPYFQEGSTGVAPEDCPNVFALRDLSILASSQSSTARFFIASIGPEHSGKTLILDLFDPGEGGQTLRIVDPNNVALQLDPGDRPDGFVYEIIPRYPSEATPSGGWGPTRAASINISGSGTQPGPNRGSNWRYNDRQIQIRIELPEDITAEYGGRTWWKVQYAFSATATVSDRTTWSATVSGDPVRLIE